MTVLTNATPNVLAAPPNAQILLAWTTFRQAFGESMPQSKPGKGGGDFDMVVRGMIGTDGIPRRGGTRLRAFRPPCGSRERLP